jgi:hypothetical protein
MHENALLRSEVHDLRQADEILSRRRRAKRSRLQRRGVMTVDEGREAIDQMDVDAQVGGKSSRSGGQERSAQAKERRCGSCSKIKHNARTCQIVVAVCKE